MKCRKMFYRRGKDRRHETTTLAKIYNKMAQIGLIDNEFIYIRKQTYLQTRFTTEFFQRVVLPPL
jgi:ribosomal protein S24E